MPKIKSIKRFSFQHKMLKFGESNDHESEFLSLITLYDDKGNMTEEQKVNTENEAEEINTFTYNDNGKLMQHVMHMITDDAKEVLKNERDEKGRLVKEQKFYGDDPGEATRYVYNDRDEVIEIHKTDEEGETESKEIIEYDEKGNLKGRTKYDAAGNLQERTEFSYDERGNISSKADYNQKNNLESKTDYSYNEKNDIISSVQKNAGGKLTESISIAYDERGNVTERNIRDFHPRKIKLIYDHKDHCIEEEVYDQHGNLSAKNIYEYDEQGNVISELNYNMDINRMSRENNSGHRYEYEFYVE